MGRPAKSVNVKSGAISKAESTVRAQAESKIRGAAERPNPPKELTKAQAEIFNFVTEELVDSEILGRLDVFVVSSFSIAVSRLQQIEAMVNERPELLFDTAIMGARSKYQNDLWRGCNELCLSPQARAKIGNMAAQAAKAKEDPLLAALRDDD